MTGNERMRVALGNCAAALGVFAAGLGFAALTGWWWNVEGLKRLLTSAVAMNPLTAMLLVLAGGSIVLRQERSDARRAVTALPRAVMATVCASLVLILSGAKVASYLAEIPIPQLDQWLFHDQLLEDRTGAPNEVAPNTALCLAFVGAALLLLDRRIGRRLWWSEMLAGATALISLLALLGYLYRVRWLAAVGDFIPMALPTAMAIQALSLALFCVRPDRGLMRVVMSRGPGGMLSRVLFPALVIVVGAIGWLRLEGERRGFYGAEIGVTVYTMANIMVFGGLIGWCAVRLYRTEAERERFFTGALELLSVVGYDGSFHRVNPAFTRVLGHAPEVLLKARLQDFVHPDDAAATLREMDLLKQGGVLNHFENRCRCADGTWRWLSWCGQTYPEENVVYAAARDVTDKKAAEEAIQRLNDELQQRAQQLEEANRELEAFSYSVSHDLRAPLRHVQGYVQMLTGEAGEQLSDKAHHYLSTIRAASLEMGHLIDDLLAFSRMGRAEMRETTVNLEGLVDEVIQREYLKQGQEVTWRRGDLPVVRCDPAMLRQVVVNLVGNAIKFSQHRKPAEIEVGSLGEEDGRAIIFVKDNGAGFDMRFAHKLFGVFQRLHRADEFEGTGIGLATVRRIIARHGGRTWAEGKLNQGATFFFTVRKAES